MEIDLLRTEHISILAEPSLSTGVSTVALAERKNYSSLRGYDLLVYNIGDHGKFHFHAVDAALQVPGICIFHDLLIFHLFEEWMARRGEAHLIPSVVDEIYGPGTFPAASDPGFLAAAAEKFSMLEWLAPHALAAVAHGRHSLSRLAQCCAGPVRHIPLAYDLPQAIASSRRKQPQSALRLTTTGHINENKLCAVVIGAMGRAARLRQHCTYRLAGPISEDMRRQLDELAARLGVTLEITGPLSRSALALEIEDADVLICLRRPILEGASASAIEAMLSGRPTVVLDHGFYRDLPGDCTVKLRADFASRDLEERLFWILDHPAEAREMGQRAASWARRQFSFDSYAQAFLELGEKTIEAAPLFRLGAQLGQELLALGVSPDDPTTIRIAEVATNLFCSGGHLCPQI
jgi:glycosyltransferase involved in cell wall biosynthesis